MHSKKLIKSIIDHAKSQGLTQVELAGQAGIHPVSLTKALTSGRYTIDTLIQLAGAVDFRLTLVPSEMYSDAMIKPQAYEHAYD